MTIEITNPEIEALIQQRIGSGEFSDAQAVISYALRTSSERRLTGKTSLTLCNLHRIGKSRLSLSGTQCRSGTLQPDGVGVSASNAKGLVPVLS